MDDNGLSTAIDFKVLLAQERRKMRAKRSESKSGSSSSSSSVGGTETVSFSTPRSPLPLERFAVRRSGGEEGDEQTCIEGVYLVPNFVTERDAMELQTATYATTENDDHFGSGDTSRKREWKDLHNRRLQVVGGYPSPDGMVPEPIPHCLSELLRLLADRQVFPADAALTSSDTGSGSGIGSGIGPPNHILLNEYRNGQGISAHKDGPLYEPCVAILSLGASATLHFWPSAEAAEGGGGGGGRHGNNAAAAEKQASLSVLLEHRSLLVFTGEAYSDYWHGILPYSQARAADDDAGTDAGADAGPGVGLIQASVDGGKEEEQEEQELMVTGHRDGSSSSSSCSSSSSRSSSSRGNGSVRLSFTMRRVAKLLSADSVIESDEARAERDRKRRFFEASVSDSGVATGSKDKT